MSCTDTEPAGFLTKTSNLSSSAKFTKHIVILLLIIFSKLTSTSSCLFHKESNNVKSYFRQNNFISVVPLYSLFVSKSTHASLQTPRATMRVARIDMTSKRYNYGTVLYGKIQGDVLRRRMRASLKTAAPTVPWQTRRFEANFWSRHAMLDRGFFIDKLAKQASFSK